MARIAIILPMETMYASAQEMASRYHLDIIGIVVIHSYDNLRETVQNFVANGADIIMARAGQAYFIKQEFQVSVVEIRLTGLDLSILLRQALLLSEKEHPKVGIIGFKNIVSVLPSPERLPNVELIPYFIDSVKSHEDVYPTWVHLVETAVSDGIDVLIGGENPCTIAANYGIPSIYALSGPESIGEACQIAKHVAYAIDQEKRNAAELQLVLDHTTDALIQFDFKGTVLTTNHAAEKLFPDKLPVTSSLSIFELLPSLSSSILTSIFKQAEEVYSVPLKIDSYLYLASVSPIMAGEQISSALLSLTGKKQAELYAIAQQKETIRQGYNAPFTFENIISRSPQMQSIIKNARRYAKFQQPILILGPFGTEKEELAQCIHNSSILSESPFLYFNCDGYESNQIHEGLFGEHGLFSHSKGTIFLNEISRLSISDQHHLNRLLMGRADSSFGSIEYHAAKSLHIIVADSHDYSSLINDSYLRKDLFYSLSAMVLELPSLGVRPDDVQGWADFFFQKLQEQYGRYVHLTAEAWKKIRNYNWPGNLAQLRSICEQIMINSPRRTVDVSFIDTLLSPYNSSDDHDNQFSDRYSDPYASQIESLLSRYHGNRKRVAEELGISITTLWRHIKKYNIQV